MFSTSDSEGRPLGSAGAVILEVNAAVEERRASDRITPKVSAELKGLGCAEGQSCTVEDMSEEGFYVCVPAQYGLCVGQRCEVHFVADAQTTAPLSLAGETCFATVVRTELMEIDSNPIVGAGLRFDQPLFF